MKKRRKDTETAILQSQSRLTVAQLATAFNVSERGIYKAKVVQLHRPDLADEVAAGRMKLHHAWQQITGHQKDTPGRRLMVAWRAASPAERALFLETILVEIEAGDDDM